MSRNILLAVAFLLHSISGCETNLDALNESQDSTIPSKTKSTSSKNLIVDTGQSVSYDSDGILIDTKEGDNFYGQDADYSGVPFAFEITDNELAVKDLNTGITWQRNASDTRVSWRDAQSHCDELELAGHSNWRVPSLKELLSIEDFSDGWPYIDTQFFSLGELAITKQLQYWSSNFYHVGTTHDGAETAFGLNFATGHIKGYPLGDKAPAMPPPGGRNDDRAGTLEAKPGTLESTDRPPPPPRDIGAPAHVGNPAHKLVRCVYGEPYGENNFVDNGDGTISDLGTGLMWLKEDSGQGLNWEQALLMAENLEYAGYNDWRLPNVKELQSIVDYSGVYPAIDSRYFSITDKDSYFWSSTSAYFSKHGTTEQSKRYWAWYVAFGYAVGPDGKDSHGAGAVRYDSKASGGPAGEDAERVFNYARAVRNL